MLSAPELLPFNCCSFETACLISKRFHALCTSPQLLRQLVVDCHDPAKRQALMAWLARHARHVRKLELAGQPQGDRPPNALSGAIMGCLCILGAAGGPEELTLEATYAGGSLRALESLELYGPWAFDEDTALPASLTRLALEGCHGREMPVQARSAAWRCGGPVVAAAAALAGAAA